MEWTADVSSGDWIRDRLDPDGPAWGTTMHAVVPRGFAAYARIFHPAARDRPVGEPWPERPYERHAREWDAFQERAPLIDTELVTWAETARAFDREMHALAQWHRLAIDSDQPEGEDGPRDAAGWRYSAPAVGTLDADVLAVVVRVALAHTTTPEDARAAVWVGFGGLVGGMGYGASRVLATSEDPDGRHGAMLGHAARDAFNDVFRKPSWQPGALSDDISRGPRLEFPQRSYVLFHTGLKELADPGWAERVPWADDLGAATQSPNLVWPVDRAWVMVTEVDFDSTVVAGSTELVRALCRDARLEALPIDEGADLSWDGDGVNR
ncbi:hypothetical protein [Microbacterium sp. 10M-3C3]|jgi:hypothetical protein|uniref:hypothetical protein n=1 Tax=Microbacterium sp. 10M-3C3 TaxID=2483401 RepID=UPI000F638019|nr:hypothetical protein [Microbacterium sp. 10M-3C3]